MANAVPMPLLSPTMTEGKIAKWNKKEGDPIKSGDSLAEVETDKATLDVEAYDPGTLLKILQPVGSTVKVGVAIAIVGKPGEDIASLVAQAGSATAAPAPSPTPAPAPAPAPTSTTTPPTSEKSRPPTARPGAVPTTPAPITRPMPAAAMAALASSNGEPQRVRSSPLARKLAQQGGIELTSIHGTGPAGRVVRRDVEAVLAQESERARVQANAPTKMMTAVDELIPLSSMRRVIAERLVQAKRDVPHFYLTVEVDMEKTVALRTELKESGSTASINDFIIRACALALQKVPTANRSFTPDGFIQHRSSDIGVAVALEEGLITPIVRDAHLKTVSAIAAEMKTLAERARNKKLKPEEYQGGSMSVSNLGMFGIDEFSAVINPPQGCILAVGAVTERPAVVNSQLAVRKRMTVTLSCDHRVIDGALGAKLLGEIRSLLEKPLTLGF